MTATTHLGYDGLRAALWLADVMSKAGISTPSALELEIRSRCGMEPENSGNLRLFAQGMALPFKRGRGPLLTNLVWPLRTETYWPGSMPWLVTPFWFLVDHLPDSGTLADCISLLPLRFQRELLDDIGDPERARVEFAFISPSCVYELTDPLGPWALGAMACAMRRARLSADLAAERWCLVGLVWIALALASEARGNTKVLLGRLADCLMVDAAEQICRNGMHAPLTTREIERFHRERLEWQMWSPESQVRAGLQPSWIEQDAAEQWQQHWRTECLRHRLASSSPK